MAEFTPTEGQRLAIEDTGGEILVSAAAGSGKTRVLTERLLRLVEAGTDIDAFLVITFTKAAAAELRAQGKRAKTSCWYAAQWFEKHPQEQDLLYKE